MQVRNSRGKPCTGSSWAAALPARQQLAYLFEVDYVDHFVWVVTDGVHRPVIAGARFVRDTNNPASAEIALTVADAYQHRGIGTLLLAGLVVTACVNGIKRFHARVLADNAAVRAWGNKLHIDWKREEPAVLAATVAFPFLENSPLAGGLPADQPCCAPAHPGIRAVQRERSPTRRAMPGRYRLSRLQRDTRGATRTVVTRAFGTRIHGPTQG